MLLFWGEFGSAALLTLQFAYMKGNNSHREMNIRTGPDESYMVLI